MSNSKSSPDKNANNAPKKANQRGAARLAAVQALYQMDIGRTSLEHTLTQFMSFYMGQEIEGDEYLPADKSYFKLVVEGVSKHQLKIDPMIDASLLEGWPVTRIDSTLRAILRGATFELLHKRDIPAKVIITEYVDIARAFFESDEPKVVNGVLNNIAHQTRQDEFTSK
ncbi:transcription antitermination factor NusB [Maritalea mediterranea]|uniref:Transcription antitermination protein NusB n=1 Tax=Maritalea mediterranea TaxID=2909667 RepID=A0ABS9E5Q5_9HYPH|nr:transcription antitermination factor NusB [Maritalea mediterranea]MCF4098181.1 transcription antitermination factor NusB [Maritalea mediterranea]